MAVPETSTYALPLIRFALKLPPKVVELGCYNGVIIKQQQANYFWNQGCYQQADVLCAHKLEDTIYQKSSNNSRIQQPVFQGRTDQ